jgi:putative tryptophan/tyrosine transport system substrate-binding protein
MESLMQTQKSFRNAKSIVNLTRALLVLLLFWSHLAEAQQPTRLPRVGFLSSSDNRFAFDRFNEGLRELGYIEGKSIMIDYRTGEAKRERLPGLIKELIDLQVDIIVSTAQPAIEDAKQITKTIPIVMIATFDPVETGVIDSLARPGGNITGVSTLQRELSGKRLEILTEVIPKASRVGLLWEPKSRGPVISFKQYESAARALKLSTQSLEVHQPNPDFGVLFSNAAKGRVDGVVVIANSLLHRHQKTIANLAIKHRLPSINERSDYVDAGGLLSYAADDAFRYRRAAYYVDRILKGTKPADLPVEQPTKFDFVINLKTAKQIGLTIPPNVLARADKVIR